MFTIGEFSCRGGVSARMLRHYDAIGLLRPVQTGNNGYRYYDEAQLPVLAQIEQLKGYGFSLAEIRALLPLPQEELAARIHVRRVQAYAELDGLRRTLRRMEDDIIQMEGHVMSLEKYHVIVMEIPAQRVFGLRRTINVAETHQLFAQLHREAEARGLRRAGVGQLVYLGDAFNYDAMDVEAQMEVTGDHPDVKEVPARLCAAVTHVGPYETLKFAYDALNEWFAAHPEYKPCGPGIERYLKDEGMAATPEELETGILFPVEKIRE